MGDFAIVYLIVNHINGKAYVGKTNQTLGRRWSQHVYKAQSGSNTHLHHAIRKYGPNAFYMQILDVPEDCLAFEKEIEFISRFGTTDRAVGYNLTCGGDGVEQTPEIRNKISVALTGKQISDVTRLKLRNANLGKKYSDETKRKVREAQRGRVFSEETRKKISLGLTGRIISDETRKKISMSLTGRKLGPYSKERAGKTADAVRAALQGRPSPLKGICRPPEVGRKISASKKGVPSPLKGRINPRKFDRAEAKFLVRIGLTHAQIASLYGVHRRSVGQALQLEAAR